jgi:YD repeat-containing protein
MRFQKSSRVSRKLAIGIVACLTMSWPAALKAQTATASYTYDAAGRIAAILFSDGTCIAHTYDANGNRTGTIITKASAPESSIWGSGVWGCFPWHP